MITADDVKKIREQSATPKLQKGKVTADMVANIRQNMAQQPVQQPVQQPTPQQTYNEAVAQAGQRHGQLAQQGQRNLAQKQAVIYSPQQQQRNNVQDFKTVLENYSKENNRLPTDPKELKALAEANGLYSGENKYQIDKLQATQGKNPVLNNEIRTSQLGSGTIKKDEAFDKSYGKREGQEEFKSLDFTSNNNSDKYEEYKQNLEIAKENKDTRNIAKYTSLLEEYKKKYKELYGNTKLETKQLPGLKRTIEQEQNDLNELSKQYLNATTPQEKNNIAVQFNRVDENLKNHTKAYQDTIAWDEIVNKNIAVDSMKSLGKNVTGGTANILNAGYTLGTKLIGDDATTINANALLNYTRPRNAVSNTIQNIASIAGSAMNPLSTITGINESPDMAYLHLTRLRATHPENQRLANLYNEITNKTYKGTAEDLKNELDTIQKELYQYAKDNILRTQDELDAVADQVRHNETYGSLSMIPNAFGTVGNMIPSMIAGAGAGEAASMAMLGLNAGGSSMDQALQSGARYNQALNYGIASGATEIATEKMFDSGANKLLGIKGSLDPKDIVKRLGIESKLGRVLANTAADVAGEMTEEMVAEAVNPLWKALSYEGLEALPQNGEELGQYIKDIINAGVEAIPSTLLMQGGGAVLNTYKTQQLENGLIKSINESDLSQIVKNQLINEVRKASTDVKLGLEESNYIQDKAYEKGFNLAAQSEQMKQRIPQGYTLPQSTLDILSFVENNRPGLTITFNANAQGNGTFIENPDGTRTITLNPNSQRAVEFTLTHELGHDLKGTQEYTQLQNLLEDYAKGKPKYQESLDALNKTYQNSNANYNLKDEATNDMLGQAIGEQEFYNKLAENPTLFNKVTSELQNLLGNKETKLKNKIEKLTRNAYQSVYKGTGSNQVQNSLSEDTGESKYLNRENYTEEQIEAIKKAIPKFRGLTEKQLDVEYSNANTNYENMTNEANKLSKEYKEFQKSEEFTKALQEYDSQNPAWIKAGEYADKIRYYNKQAEKYYAQREAINSIKLGAEKDTRTAEQIVKDAEEHFGTTNDYNETAYITTNGKQLNFSGHHEGGTRGRRALDHRQINEIGTDMDSFISYGNIRIKPEADGIHLAIEPNQIQYEKLEDFIDNFIKPKYNNSLSWMGETIKQEGTVWIDIDAEEGDIRKDYSTATPTSKIINDIKTYFRTGKYPETQYMYSKSNGKWQQFLDKNFNWRPNGTRTNFTKTDTTMLPSNEELIQNVSKSVENEPILSESLQNNAENEQKTKLSTTTELDDLRSFKKVGDRKVNAYQYDNPEVKPFFQYEAGILLDDLNNAIKGERYMVQGKGDYGLESYGTWDGTKRSVVQDIADLLDGKYGAKLSYDDIRKGLNAIINDNGAENIAAAKRIEMVLDKRLRKGYTDSFGYEHNQSENYNKFLNGEEYVDPLKYDYDYLVQEYGEPGGTDDGTLFSLSEKEQQEISQYADKLENDKTLDNDFASSIFQKLGKVRNYSDFENIKQEVSDYKDKMYKGISGLEDIANMKESDVVARPLEYKQRVDKNTTEQRGFFENMETSPIVAEETRNRVNATTYEQQGNSDTLEEMRQKLDERGNDLIDEWKTKSKNFTAKDVALGAILVERYQQNGDWDSAARAVEKLADMGTEAGRAVQMYSIFQRLSPETMAIYQQKALNQAFEEMKQRKTGKWVEANKDKFKLTDEDTKFIYEQVEKASQAIDDETKQRELSKIEKRINEKLPAKAGDAIRTLRRISMLFNPKTQVRNVVGNSLIMPVNAVTDFVGTQIDKAIAKKTGTRTTNYANPIEIGKGFVKGIKAAVKDYKTGTRTAETGNKWEFEFGSKPFNENTKNKAINAVSRKLNKLNDLLSAIMSGGDRPFYEGAFNNSLKGQMKANKVDVPTQDMIDIAVNEALQRTWNDDNEYTKTVLGIRKAMNGLNVHGFGLGDLIIPFARTPANLTKAMVEYSPVGFIPSVMNYIDMNKAISRGELTPQQQKKFVSSMSKAIAGTMLYAIAGTLARGIGGVRITGSADDDKDVKNFEQNVLGIQPYSVILNGKSYTYSWANPINAPLAIMADSYKLDQEDANLWDKTTNLFKVAGNVLTENSFLQGIQELFSKDSLTEGLVDSITGMPESLVPTFISQIASAFDNKKRQTFEYKNDLGTITNKIKNKLPGAKNTLAPQVNTFGEEIDSQNNFFNVFLNPANVREAEITDSQKALYEVYQETKDKTIFPMQAPYYTNTDTGEKKNLSSKERVAYQKASGQYVTEVYDDLFNNEAFNNSYHINNEAKTTILKKIAEDGNAKGREAVGAISSDTNSNLDKLNERNEILNNAGIPLADYYIAWYSQKNVSKKQAKKTAISQQLGNELDKEQKEVLYGIFNID